MATDIYRTLTQLDDDRDTMPYRVDTLFKQRTNSPWYKRFGQKRISQSTYDALKRLMDLLLGLVSLPLVLILLSLCALAIRLEGPGPIFFSQERTGKGGRRFRLFKLRTMVTNAEEIKQKLQDLNELSYPDFKIKNDPRVTRVGQFLRRTSLDELPQIWNILNGDMSFVGPRPTSFSADTYQLWQTARLDIRPGLTGLWQVDGRNELDFDQRLRLDIAYIRHQSLGLDIAILLRTVGAVFTGRGAS